jgi:hypothetical protein
LALFVFGAGATRGCSFVDATKDPCLPPLDIDFFTQLQKVQNPKHKNRIKAVMEDVVDLFGQNFSVSMETVFTTLENTIRMLETTGDNREFKRTGLKDKLKRLEQAIAVVFEDSLADKDEEGHSSQKARQCEYHRCFVKDLLNKRDDIISFNYDCVLDYALKQHGDSKWNPRYGYSFKLGSRGKLLTGDDQWMPLRPAKESDTVHLYKLHGSLHFQISEDSRTSKVHLKQRPYTGQFGSMRFTIIPPEWHKAYDKGTFALLWKNAAGAIQKARNIVFIGYSLPPTDLHASALFQTSVRKSSLESLVVVNPDRDARRRIRTVLQRGLNSSTVVLSFDSLQHFVSARRGLWEK